MHVIVLWKVRIISAPKTRQREIQGLLSALRQFHLREGWIITRNDYEDLNQEGHRIYIRPFWHFALDRQSFPFSTGAIL